MFKNVTQGVEVWEQDIVIPTYPVGTPDKNPMFLEKRVYQGSSGKVYPHSVIDKIYDEKIDKTYKALCLENKYLFVMVLPELGGRIQRAYDKTNDYDFVYYNHVIKPALVGLAGPWISGGIEFNWPQHHRPSTFDPVDYKTSQNEDGSCTIWVSEIENMFRTKGMAGFTLYPDKAYIEINAQLYNRTGVPQTFLWWANPAVAVNDHTQSIFPPDVHAVMDHGKRDVSRFPIATGTYYKQDYSAGVDISRYKNIPVPTSYMAYHSDYNFVGGYDYGRQAGILHVADHHVSPGKKQWTWGCGDFGQAWDRNLTDSDGPYIELMTGCFTDNQPDFTWLMPYEEKVFTQYFMPYKQVGQIKNATIHAAVNLELKDGNASVTVYAAGEYQNARIILKDCGSCYIDTCTELTPIKTFAQTVPVGCNKETELTLTVLDEKGRVLVAYTPKEAGIEKIPEPAKAAPDPKDARTNEDLFLYGLHIEQYRHATYEAADYYEEGLRRDPTDIRINNAYGSLLLRRGQFEKAEGCFKAAVAKLTRSNPNPYDGEPLYNLGLCERLLGKLDSAYDHFYKATWSDAWQGSGFYHLACIDMIRGDNQQALAHIERSLIRNTHNMKARTVKTALLRKLGLLDKAEAFAQKTLSIDVMDYAACCELALISGLRGYSEAERSDKKALCGKLGLQHNWYIELSLEYAEAGMYNEANDILKLYAEAASNEAYPMVFYHMGYNALQLGDEMAAKHYFELAAKACGDYCFPHRLEDILALSQAVRTNPTDAMGYYYLGNLWYDKKQYEQAVRCWEESRRLNAAFPTVHRNLSLAYYNKHAKPQEAREELETAFSLNPNDSRVFMELDQLYKKLGISPKERLEHFKAHLKVVDVRDDLTLEYITLLNLTGAHEEALALLEKRQFHPWEGGEGKVPAQFILSLTELAKKEIKNGRYQQAAELLERATAYPHNLGEGKLAGAQENNIYYFMGTAYEGLNDRERAAACFEKASTGLSEPAGMMYYNDQPPEMIFYQGLALLKLGRTAEAGSRFNKLISYGEKHIYDTVKIDYFAVSLPDLMIFDEDLNQKNRVHCLFMIALGYLGKGERLKAQEYLTQAEALDKNHIGITIHKAFSMQ